VLREDPTKFGFGRHLLSEMIAAMEEEILISKIAMPIAKVKPDRSADSLCRDCTVFSRYLGIDKPGS